MAPASRTNQGRFAPGVSGNPRGRGAEESEIRRAIRAALRDRKDGTRAIDRLIAALVSKAEGGNIAAAKILIEYAYGKPALISDALAGIASSGVLSIPDLAAIAASMPDKDVEDSMRAACDARGES